ncbi:hypothetical protein DXD61_03980 [Eubacterium sp. TM06-47]|nr:hypothetical protein DXD61_03980 [Eubacterium sp. TM06-47]
MKPTHKCDPARMALLYIRQQFICTTFKFDAYKTFHHFNFTKLRKTFQFELIRLIQEAGGLKKPEEKNRLYKDHPKGFYVYAKFKSNDNDSNNASSNKNSKDIQGCVNYFIRYAGRPAMAENRITEYNKESKTVSWFYNDHKDEKRHFPSLKLSALIH